VNINAQTVTYTPSPAKLKLALVDLFGDAVESDFEIHFLNNVPTECSNMVISKPLVPDQIYIIGETEKIV
jgi:hypothetical protein